MKKRMTNLLCLVLALLLTACGSKPAAEPTVPETTAPVETTAAAIPETTAATEPETLPLPAEDIIIDTPYGGLHFPGDWEPFLKTVITDNPYTVTFFAELDTRPEPQKLFEISFGVRAENAAAAVKTDEGYVAVGIYYEEFKLDETWSDRDINIIFTMQEALNHILDNLPLEDADVLAPVPTATEPSSGKQQDTLSEDGQLPESMLADMAIDTPYMELHYPSMWADTLSMKVSEGDPYSVGYYAVIGSHSQLHLFTVYFGGEKGTLLKSVKAPSGDMVEIRIEVPELSLEDGWSEDEKSIAHAMQEDLNYLLGKMN